MSPETTLKLLPDMPSKAEVLKLFRYRNQAFIISEINTALELFGYRKTKKILPKPVFKYVLNEDRLGTPEGYKPFV